MHQHSPIVVPLYRQHTNVCNANGTTTEPPGQCSVNTSLIFSCCSSHVHVVQMHACNWQTCPGACMQHLEISMRSWGATSRSSFESYSVPYAMKPTTFSCLTMSACKSRAYNRNQRHDFLLEVALAVTIGDSSQVPVNRRMTPLGKYNAIHSWKTQHHQLQKGHAHVDQHQTASQYRVAVQPDRTALAYPQQLEMRPTYKYQPGHDHTPTTNETTCHVEMAASS